MALGASGPFLVDEQFASARRIPVMAHCEIAIFPKLPCGISGWFRTVSARDNGCNQAETAVHSETHHRHESYYQKRGLFRQTFPIRQWRAERPVLREHKITEWNWDSVLHAPR